jgi:RNA polymerase sigma-70 factor (ECF subfamily)
MPRLSRESFEVLVREHHAAVHRSASRLLASAAEAADVTQDVFVRVLEGKVRLEAADSARATLCWLATCLARNVRRSRRRRQDHEENAMMTNPAHDSERDDPARTSADRDLHRTVQGLLERLPTELRLPLQLRCQDDLTFAAIGTSLSISESTAHDRVQQALERLRTALTGRGFALAPAGLAQLVHSLPLAAPPDLQARLLALGSGGGAAAAGAAWGVRAGIGFAAVAVAVGGLALFVGSLSGGATAPERAFASASVEPAAPEPPGSSSAPEAPAAAPTGERTAIATALAAPDAGERPAARTFSTFQGTVHDAGAWPVGGATVQAVAAGGLKGFDLGATTTDEAGGFRLEVRDSWLKPSAIRLRVVEDGIQLFETGELALPRAEGEEPLALVLPAEAGDAMSHFELAVTVLGADGVPITDVPIALLRGGEAPRRVEAAAADARAVTGGDGLATLRGRRLGAKWIFVDGRSSGRASQLLPFVVRERGLHRHTVTLERGHAFAANIAAIDGELLPWANVWLEDESTGLTHGGKLGPDGCAHFSGLGGGTYALHVSSEWNRSPALRRGLRAADSPVDLRLKPRAEQRDVGDHMAELHGELFDAVTGEVVEWRNFQVDVLPARQGASTLAADRIVPRGPVQTMLSDSVHGDFHEVGLEAGRFALIASVPGYAQTVAEFELRDGELRTGLRVPLHRGGELTGRVVDEHGEPVARARVFVIGVGDLADRCLEQWRDHDEARDDLSAPPTHPAARSDSDQGGTFTLARVPPGVEVRVAVRHREGFAVSPSVVVGNGETLELRELRLEQR